jgi:hypothetical protein
MPPAPSIDRPEADPTRLASQVKAPGVLAGDRHVVRVAGVQPRISQMQLSLMV